MNFKTEVDVSIIWNGLAKGYAMGQGGKCVIEWTGDLELGATGPEDKPTFFGIKSIKLEAPDQTLKFKSFFFNEDTEEETQKEVTIEVKNIKINKDLGECNLDDFKLLPTELIIHGNSAELCFK